MLPISVRKEKIDSIRQIQKACKNFKISFSSLVVDLTIIGFETGKWGIILDKEYKKNVLTTDEIISNGDLDGTERWVKL
jgi:hypothetical protein